MKSTVVAKVAAQTADYYGDAMRALDNSAVRAQWDKVSCRHVHDACLYPFAY